MMGADIAIVGGGPAGLTAALALAAAAPARADRIVVLEKETYPRDKICAGAVGDRGWRILEALDAAPTVPWVRVGGIQLDTRAASMRSKPGPIGRVVRRREFDAALAERAIDRGVRVMQDCAVQAISVESDGATLSTTQGDLRVKAAVGADGVGSVVRRAMGCGVGRLRAMVVELDTGPAPGDPPRDVLRFDAREADLPGYYWDFPTLVDGEPLWCRGLYLLRVAADLEPGMAPADHIRLRDRLDAWMAAKGLDRSAYRNKRFAERGWEPSVEPAQGPLLLVGEAMGIDPISGEGISQAIESGRDLGRFLATAEWSLAGLAGWSRAHRRSRVGRDLSVRRRLVRVGYGPPRPWLERLLAGNEALLAAGCHHWGGAWPPLGVLLTGVGQAAWRQLRGGAAPALPVAS